MKDFDNDNFKKLKEKLSKEKGTISKCDFAESINKIVTSAIGAMVFFNNMDLAFEIAALKTNEAMDELFSKEPAEEPDAEKPAEKTAPSALEKLLFEQAYFAAAQCAAESSVVHHAAGSSGAYSSFKALYGLVMDAGLEEKYNFWKAVNGYE